MLCACALPFLFIIILFSMVHPVLADFAPDFTLTDIDGNTFSLKDFRGKIVIIDFFSIQCQPCIEQIAEIKTVRSQFGEELVVISISRYVDPTDTTEKLEAFRSDYNITWVLARDLTGTSEVYNVTAYPTLYIVDKNGYLGYKHVGYVVSTPPLSSVLAEEVTALIPEYSFLFLPLLMTLAAIAIILSHTIRRRSQGHSMEQG